MTKAYSDDLRERVAASVVARKRARWKAHQGRIDPARLVFIDDPKDGA